MQILEKRLPPPNQQPTNSRGQLASSRGEQRKPAAEEWERHTRLLRDEMMETDWSLEDGSQVELPVELGRGACGDFLQLAGDRL